MNNDLNKKLATLYAKYDCNISKACEKAGVPRQYFLQQHNENKEFKEAIWEANEALIDLAESKLIEKIKEGSLRAIIFYLKAKGKRRGYTEAIEVQGLKGEKRVVIILPDNGRSPKKLTHSNDEDAEDSLTDLTHIPKKEG